MIFENYSMSGALRKGVDELGFKQATVIQKEAFSPICSGADICGIAQTGTGKTFAYLIPLLRMWSFSKETGASILVLVPTRELAVQLLENVQVLSQYMPFEAAAVYGGVNMNTQRLSVERKLDLIVGTPGRVYDLAVEGSLKLKKIKHLVIDEMDEMLSQGFLSQMRNILELIPERRQNVLFSATVTEPVIEIIHTHLNNPVWIEAAAGETVLENIEQMSYPASNFNTRKNLLEYLLQNDMTMQKVLIFVEGKKRADLLYEALWEEGKEKAAVIHGNKAQNTRFQAVTDFESGNKQFLIATDIISRGIDVKDISHVINFDLPEHYEDYIHRMGRTGRAEKSGVVISFYAEEQTHLLTSWESQMQIEIQRLDTPESLVSEILIDEELKKPYFPDVPFHPPVMPSGAGAFHEKSEKNKKQNKTLSKKERMKLKYGKPKTRGQKRKRR